MSSDQDDSDPLEGCSNYIFDTLQIEIKQEAVDDETTENMNPAFIQICTSWNDNFGCVEDIPACYSQTKKTINYNQGTEILSEREVLLAPMMSMAILCNLKINPKLKLMQTSHHLSAIVPFLSEILKVTLSDPIELNSADAIQNPNSGLMVCVHCFQEMAYEVLLHHMMTVHSYRKVPFKCYNCKAIYQSRSQFYDHKQTCKPAKSVKKKAFKQIKETDPTDGSINTTCPICNVGLSKKRLKEHLITVHNNPVLPVVCSVCNKTFKGKVNLRAHVRLVHNAVEDSVECDLCGQTFSSLKYMASHKRNVHPAGDKWHPCLQCGKQFKSHHCLHQHTKSVHPPDSASVQCPHCRKTYKSKISLRQHLRVAHNSRPAR